MEIWEGYSIRRLCLLDGGGLTDIFEANPADGWPVAHLIQDLVQLQMSLITDKEEPPVGFTGEAEGRQTSNRYLISTIFTISVI
ncbi:hypothetical protein J437_LFUL016979 [Ladona fulva]|uniref:Uncharacterized protein n=1 Tax=Ladona fulva TaxID=123851 RepID=A0A8K0KMK5_LADFU|nr:hypothetical protein J437_LFUL016979 [Ladona fulva]